MPSIIPTVGRKVYFYENDEQVAPHDATIIKVHASPEQAWPGSCVNLLVIDPDTAEGRLVTSANAYDEPQTFPHYRWMPYQVGQAKKETPQPDIAATQGAGTLVGSVTAEHA